MTDKLNIAMADAFFGIFGLRRIEMAKRDAKDDLEYMTGSLKGAGIIVRLPNTEHLARHWIERAVTAERKAKKCRKIRDRLYLYEHCFGDIDEMKWSATEENEDSGHDQAKIIQMQAAEITRLKKLNTNQARHIQIRSIKVDRFTEMNNNQAKHIQGQDAEIDRLRQCLAQPQPQDQ